MEDTVNFIGLGLVASHKRKIRDGKAFDKYFPRPLRTDPYLNWKASVFKTVDYCEKIVRSTLRDTAKIARLLKRPTQYETLKAIFDFFYNHYQYKQDKEGVEQLRRPARAWHDRGTSHKGGVDCDCFAISVSSVLMNLGIRHYFRIVKLYGRDYYQHIYIIVPKAPGLSMNHRSNYTVIDPVLDQFDKEAPDITSKNDHEMIPVQYLNGVGDNSPFGTEFDGLGLTLGCVCGEGLRKDFKRRLKRHIYNTRNHIARNPDAYSKLYKPHVLRGMYDELVGTLGNDEQFENKLGELSFREEEAMNEGYNGLGNAIHGNDSGLYSALFGQEDDQMLSGLGHQYECNGMLGLGRVRKRKSGIFTKLKNAFNTAKGKAGGILKNAKNLARNVIKYNPLLFTARAGFLIAMRLNFGRLASKAYWGYFSQSDAAKKGVTAQYWNKSKALLNSILATWKKKMLGDESVLRRAIINGRAAKRIQKGAIHGLGVVVAAASATAITAALSFLTGLLKMASGLFKKNNGKEETETGGEQTAVSDDPKVAASQTDPGTIVEQDGSVQAAKEANKSNPEEQDPLSNPKSTGKDPVPGDGSIADDAAKEEDKKGGAEKSGSKKGLLIGGVALAAVAAAAFAMKGKGKKSSETSKGTGVSGTHKKRKRRRKKVRAVKLS